MGVGEVVNPVLQVLLAGFVVRIEGILGLGFGGSRGGQGEGRPTRSAGCFY